MKIPLSVLIVMIALLSSCKTSRQSLSGLTITADCQKYFDFFQANTRKTEGGWYEFISEEAIYKKYDEGDMNYPFGMKCTLGKSKEYIREFYGEPHREIEVPHHDFNIFVYCYDERCYNNRRGYAGISSSGFIVYFDKDDRLIEIFTNISFYESWYKFHRKKE